MEIKKYVDINDIYPIGSIYMNINNINPEIVFGGQWEQIQDTFLLGCGAYASAGAIGGSEKHTLTINEMPSHNHTSHGISIATTGNLVNLALRSVELGNKHTGDTIMRTNNTGNGLSFSIMPPYLAVYIWKRVG